MPFPQPQTALQPAIVPANPLYLSFSLPHSFPPFLSLPSLSILSPPCAHAPNTPYPTIVPPAVPDGPAAGSQTPGQTQQQQQQAAAPPAVLRYTVQYMDQGQALRVASTAREDGSKPHMADVLLQ